MFTSSPRQPTSISLSLSNIMLFAAIFTLGCLAMALPVSESVSSAAKHDLNSLNALLGNFRDAQRQRHNVLESTDSLTGRRQEKTSALEAMLLKRAAAAIDADFDTDIDMDEESEDDDTTSNMRKRQGAWSYDYGLGGGRFGKRGYGYPDYGLGGGRFGRDVDHVDPNHDIDVAA